MADFLIILGAIWIAIVAAASCSDVVSPRLIVLGAICIGSGLYAGRAARKKGHNFAPWFLLGTIFPIIVPSMINSGGLKDKKDYPAGFSAVRAALIALLMVVLSVSAVRSIFDEFELMSLVPIFAQYRWGLVGIGIVGVIGAARACQAKKNAIYFMFASVLLCAASYVYFFSIAMDDRSYDAVGVDMTLELITYGIIYVISCVCVMLNNRALAAAESSSESNAE